jgi:poly(hydroxyalkanoate) granule-associated protein
MAKKLKALAGEDKETNLSATIRDSAHNIWLAGLGAFAKAQEEGSKVFDALVKEGEAVQRRTKHAADEKISELSSTATGTWDKLEQVFEDRVARAMRGLGVPTNKDVEKLSDRVAKLTAVVEKLSQTVDQKSGGASTRRTAKKSA